jgi:ATP-dependent Zn protease
MTLTGIAMDDDQDSRIEIALHEAGHAVIARVVGLIGDRATIVPKGTARGKAWWADDSGIKSVLACLAGRAATEVILGYASDEGCSRDDAEAMALIRTPDWRREEWYCRKVRDDLLAQARKLIRQNRGAVEAVAHYLIERGELTGDEIDRLIQFRWLPPATVH